MRTIPISKPIKNFEGKDMTDGPAPLTIGRVLVFHLGNFTSRDGRENIRAFKLGTMIEDCKAESMDFEDADFALIKKALEPQEPRMGALVMGQVLAELEKD